ncbi:hypothetical protein I309_00215 [Cryptococcus deuterogattii LA55]|nr:hypothetical protein I309_00215 [Cryptococcus deuterogattii LA55]KIR95045.1 hypothetical protein I304_01371 [Cryptococcus deuterogattii CBS 10090]
MASPSLLHEHVRSHAAPLARPHVTLTWAQSLDSKIAGVGGKRVILSGPESMLMTHQSVLPLPPATSRSLTPPSTHPASGPSTTPSSSASTPSSSTIPAYKPTSSRPPTPRPRPSHSSSTRPSASRSPRGSSTSGTRNLPCVDGR